MADQNKMILVKQERTMVWVRLLPWAVRTTNSEQTFCIHYTPLELFRGGRFAWVFKTTFPEDYKRGDWLEHKQDFANWTRANLKQVFVNTS